ncbi:MAG: hypothetical protein KGJ86_11755 [Chloroflexota bacterium]|nr:hypothetical protein [Chloroflexota bacterium]
MKRRFRLGGKRLHHPTAAQAIAEFALACPIMLFAMVGLFELNMYQLDAYRTQDAAIAACDAVSEATTEAQAQQLASSAVSASAAAMNLRDAALVSLSGLPAGSVGTGSTYFCIVRASHHLLSATFAGTAGWSVPMVSRAAGAISGRNPG